MSLETFIESLENVPPELERNFTLILELDKRTNEIMERIDECAKEYKTAPKSRRLVIKKETDELFEKLNSFADDKIELAESTYELIDRNIRKLVAMGNTHDEADIEGKVSNALKFDMPLDPNEPKYCVCQGVSYGEMVACENPECPIEWFHYACVGLTSAPKGKWYCATCVYTNVKRRPRSRRSKRY